MHASAPDRSPSPCHHCLLLCPLSRPPCDLRILAAAKMASGSPKSRVDQLFASRKRRPQSLKEEKPHGNPKTTPESSPSGKGSLDSYLVKSSDSQRRLDLVKRNISLEIGLSSETAQKPVLRSCSSERTDGRVGEHGEQVLEKEVSVCESKAGGNSELEKFATDFLSLYYSEVLLVEQEQKGQKKNGSPSLLVVCDQTNVKKQCALKVEDDAPVHDGSECSESKMSMKTQEMIDFSASKPTVSMRRCSGTPIAGLHAPGMFNTPGSVSRKSLISPGDEFWNEAFDVADGFYHPLDEAFCARGERENVCPMDLSSCIAPSGGGIILRSENGAPGS